MFYSVITCPKSLNLFVVITSPKSLILFCLVLSLHFKISYAVFSCCYISFISCHVLCGHYKSQVSYSVRSCHYMSQMFSYVRHYQKSFLLSFVLKLHVTKFSLLIFLVSGKGCGL